MGSEQSSNPHQRSVSRAPPIKRGYTVAGTGRPEHIQNHEHTASGNDSPGASVCSDSELPYISYTVGRPIGDSPKHTAKNRQTDGKKSVPPRRQMSLQSRQRPVHDIVVVKQPKTMSPNSDLDIKRIQNIPTFLPIMRATLGLPGARDPEVLEGLDYRPWVRLTSRYQAHLTACAQPLAADQAQLTTKVKEIDMEISRLYSQFVDRQRENARNAERLSRVREMSHQLSRCQSLLTQTLQDIEQYNNMLPEEKRLEKFIWNEKVS